MPTTDTDTVLEICTDALRKIGVVSIGERPEADSIATALRNLNRLLKSWQNRKIDLWLATGMSVTATTSAVYTLDPVRPMDISTARFKRNGIELPMQRMTREEYDTLPNKATTGIPTTFYYDRQREAARLYVWPVLATVAGQTIEITYTREIEDMLITDVLDCPPEWYDAVVYGLASRLSDDYMISAPNVMGREEEEFRKALAFDREGSVFFAGGY